MGLGKVLGVGLGMVLGMGLVVGLGMVLGVGVWGSEVFANRLLCIIRETKVGTKTENTEGLSLAALFLVAHSV